ncbi:MAG: HlyC/CorC family transporter [Alphaproteobacteria bacterium]|nr:HlyC/CorC family transporter [Alphaproteobacteria bacterium]
MTDVIILFVLILVNAFFAMAELAMMSARQARLKQLASEGHRAAKSALTLLAEPSRLLATVQVGVTLISVFTGAYGGTAFAAPLGAWLNQFDWVAGQGEAAAFFVVVSVLTYVSLVLGELVPKRIAVVAAEPIALAISPFLQILQNMFAPFVWMLRLSTDVLLKLLGLAHVKAETVTEDEVKQLISEGTETGVFEAQEQSMLEGVMRLTDRNVRSIMTPRPDVLWLDMQESREDMVAKIIEARASRLPVADGDLDQIKGVVQAKDLLADALSGKPLDIMGQRQDVLLVPETTPVLKLMEQMRTKGQHMAVVIDEYGTVEGVVTPTDILTAITGELPDQDEDEPPQAVQRSDGSWLLDGTMSLEDVELSLQKNGLKDDAENYHTLAGFITAQLGRLPTVTDSVTWENLRFEVVDMDGHRVDKVLVQKNAEPREDDGV